MLFLKLIGIKTKAARRNAVLVPSCLLFILGSVLLMNLDMPRGKASAQNRTPTRENPAPSEAIIDTTAEARAAARPVPVSSSRLEQMAATSVNNFTSEADISYLRAKRLLIPVEGVIGGNLRDSFQDPRSEGRLHHAIDIMAPQGTPVLATTDGKLKLHTSDKGGIMLYQTDSLAPYVYYYAHLQRYADGIYEGKDAQRGEVIAYVGDTGNAGAGNFHLHFGISKMYAPGKWSGGEPINPYPLLALQ